MRNRKSTTGFTLVELMVVVAIIALLASIAYPGYQSQVRKTRRADAEGALSSFASAMERYYTENNTYLGAAGTGNPVVPADTGAPRIFPIEAPLDGATKTYDLRIQAAGIGSFTLRATPKNAQAGDGILELLNTGERHWDKNNDGSIATAEQTW
jgi:type IV pilus assembly protein PilE